MALTRLLSIVSNSIIVELLNSISMELANSIKWRPDDNDRHRKPEGRGGQDNPDPQPGAAARHTAESARPHRRPRLPNEPDAGVDGRTPTRANDLRGAVRPERQGRAHEDRDRRHRGAGG